MLGEEKDKNSNRPPPLGGGPLGLGDPNDLRLRKTEKDVILPKMMKEEAERRCPETLKVFLECAKNTGLLVPFKCQEENNKHNDCMLSFIKNPEFVKEITDKYLAARSHYRRTGEPLERYKRKKSAPAMC